MELMESIIQAQAPKKKRKSKVSLLDSVKQEPERNDMNSEHDDLNLHVSLCEERYKALEGRLDAVEQKLIKMEDQISAIKGQMASGFNDIRLLIEKQNNARTIQIITTFGSIAVAVIGVMGYLLTH
jgi:predicted  nucleic acid-binding Zn-ribbon protein